MPLRRGRLADPAEAVDDLQPDDLQPDDLQPDDLQPDDFRPDGGPDGDELAEAERAASELAAVEGAAEPSAGEDPGAPARKGGRFRHEVLAVVFQVRHKRLQVLMWQRGQAPFEGCWALPGGPLGADERLGTSLGRHLAAKVDITDVAHLEQLETRSDPDRDPREREVATAYLALVSTDVDPAIPSDTAWHPVQSLPPSAFDHASIIQSARERLRAKLTYTNAGFALAPATFTIAELRDIYAACIGHPVAATNLQRVLTRRCVIEPTQATVQRGPAGGRPAALYRFARSSLVVTDPFAVFRPPAGGSSAS